MDTPLDCPPVRANEQEDWHGTANGYQRCRRRYKTACAPCKAAWSEKSLETRRKTAGSMPELNPHLDHGSPWTNGNYGCTCGPCMDALNGYRRDLYARRRAERAS